MPTVITHALTGLVLGKAVYPRKMPWRFWGWAAMLPIIPDFDVIGFRLGVHYGDFLGHRGFFHSICFAFALGLLPMWELRRAFNWRKTTRRHTPAEPCSVKLSSDADAGPNARLKPRWAGMYAFFCIIAASHGLMDAATDGGLGIALLSPFDTTRYFFPWTPILVSPIGLRAFLSRWGFEVVVSEAKWVWLPLAALFVAARGWEYVRGRARSRQSVRTECGEKP